MLESGNQAGMLMNPIALAHVSYRDCKAPEEVAYFPLNNK